MTAPTPPVARIRWTGTFGFEHEPRRSGVRYFGYDASCSCGYATRTGGAIEARVRELVQDHLLFDHAIGTGPYREYPARALDEIYAAGHPEGSAK